MYCSFIVFFFHVSCFLFWLCGSYLYIVRYSYTSFFFFLFWGPCCLRYRIAQEMIGGGGGGVYLSIYVGMYLFIVVSHTYASYSVYIFCMSVVGCFCFFCCAGNENDRRRRHFFFFLMYFVLRMHIFSACLWLLFLFLFCCAGND